MAITQPKIQQWWYIVSLMCKRDATSVQRQQNLFNNEVFSEKKSVFSFWNDLYALVWGVGSERLRVKCRDGRLVLLAVRSECTFDLRLRDVKFIAYREDAEKCYGA